MRQIPYNNSAATLVFDYPPTWDVPNITGVNITVDDVSGTELRGPSATTLYTADTLAAAAAVGDSYIQITTGNAPVPGREYEIAASASGPAEVVTCKYYDSSNKYLYTTSDLREAHASSAAVRGCYCTYDLSTASTSVWTKGRQLVITWTPGGSDDIQVKERAAVANVVFGGADFEQRFRGLYRLEYEILQARSESFEALYNEAYEQLRLKLWARHIDLDRVVDSNIVMPALMAQARYLVLLDVAGDGNSTEMELARKERDDQFETIAGLPLWEDSDQDEVRDEHEIEDHGASRMIGGRGW